MNDQEVIGNLMSQYLPVTEMAQEKLVDSLAGAGPDSQLLLVIELNGKDGGIPIGNINLHRVDVKNQHAYFGILIGEKEHWCKGCGTEATRLLLGYAFNQMNLQRITSHVFAFNERSVAMHKKAGFTEEGRMRKAMFKHGEFKDVVVFGVLREEWK
jgi:RimJ/RimL family protein N-acetyltransferase